MNLHLLAETVSHTALLNSKLFITVSFIHRWHLRTYLSTTQTHCYEDSCSSSCWLLPTLAKRHFMSRLEWWKHNRNNKFHSKQKPNLDVRTQLCERWGGGNLTGLVGWSHDLVVINNPRKNPFNLQLTSPIHRNKTRWCKTRGNNSLERLTNNQRRQSQSASVYFGLVRFASIRFISMYSFVFCFLIRRFYDNIY